MDRHGAKDAPQVLESHDVPSCLRFPPNPRATHARCGHPSWKKLDAQAHRRDCEAAAEAGRRRPAAGAPSPPRSMLTHPRFRPGSMHSAADSSVHLATLTLGRRGVRRRVAGVDAPARPRQVFSQRDVCQRMVSWRRTVMAPASSAWCGSRVALRCCPRGSFCPLRRASCGPCNGPPDAFRDRPSEGACAAWPWRKRDCTHRAEGRRVNAQQASDL